MLTFIEHFEKLQQEKLDKAFDEESQDVDLQEGLIRSGAVGVYAAKSRQDGDQAVRHFNKARDTLRWKSSKKDEPQCDDRLRQAFDEMLVGLIHMRNQSGNALAANVAGHLLATGTDPEGRKKRR